MSFHLIVAAACSMMASIFLTQEPAEADARAELKAADRAFCADTQRRGVDGWLAHFAPEALVFPHVGPLARGAEERSAHFRGRAFPPPGFTWEPDDAWCAASGDLGFTRGAWSADPASKEEPRHAGRYLSVWKRFGERWLVLADLGDDPSFLHQSIDGNALGTHTCEVQFHCASADRHLQIEAGVVRGADARTGKFLRVWRKGDGEQLQLLHQTGAWDLELPRMTPWPEADALFRSDPRWRGGDGASSVRLDDQRLLWLFADSFVAAPEGRRRGSRMVRNSIAIQSGRDPLRAKMQFHWREEAGAPVSFFRLPDVAEQKQWLWPASGIRVGKRLLLFFFVLTPQNGGLGFHLEPSRAAWIDDVDLAPEQWSLRWNEELALPPGLLLGGGGCFFEGEFLVAISPSGGDHAAMAVRFPKQALEAGQLDRTEAWVGSAGWQTLAEHGANLEPLFTPGQSELSVLRIAAGKWIATHGLGFGPAPLGIRHAAALEGPWSNLQVLHRPVEATREQILIYAEKAHPDLICPQGIALTYVANSLDFATLIDDESLYFPRFLRLQWP